MALVEAVEECEGKRCKPISSFQISEDIFEDRKTNSPQDQHSNMSSEGKLVTFHQVSGAKTC